VEFLALFRQSIDFLYGSWSGPDIALLITRSTGEETAMNFFTELLTEEDGQGLTEYALIVFLVVLVFWLGVKDTNIGNQLAGIWGKVVDCLSAPVACVA
jgi:Flp pilus assembly pilin Flp